MTAYWPQKGPANTEQTVALALKRAQELGIEHIVVASCSGETAKKLVGKVPHLVCVTHHVGFAGPGVDEMPPEVREELASRGVKLLTTTHLMGGLDRGVRNKFGGVYPAEIIAQTLRMLGQGLKVCVEIAVMALDAGLIPFGREVIAVGGSSKGADTAAVILPAHSHHFFDTKIKEIICKPREF
ncbi:pyruvate kinase alpha/beta domain-containing protein [Desulfovirgula thermocuniculi]|uniref:pyruvate kinase alpha/beta domain-containing protein n=1 Tax=Desulfovirgula thermocuniculi TaxID=348842 RepID=UPI0003F52CAB|nr:pyruvate kinase alpha/beta domain-containing protein [Desulfovirgula thermocuniculi]